MSLAKKGNDHPQAPPPTQASRRHVGLRLIQVNAPPPKLPLDGLAADAVFQASQAATITSSEVERQGHAHRAAPAPPALLSYKHRWLVQHPKGDMHAERITLVPGLMGGRPTLRGMRFAVADVLEYLAGGMTTEDLLAEFPFLEREDILACLDYAARQARHEFIQLDHKAA